MRRALLNCCALLDGLGVAAWLGFFATCKDCPRACFVFPAFALIAWAVSSKIAKKVLNQ